MCIVNFSVDICVFSGDDNPNTSSRHDENDMSSSLYRLEIVGIELLSLYGTEVCFFFVANHRFFSLTQCVDVKVL